MLPELLLDTLSDETVPGLVEHHLRELYKASSGEMGAMPVAGWTYKSSR